MTEPDHGNVTIKPMTILDLVPRGSPKPLGQPEGLMTTATDDEIEVVALRAADLKMLAEKTVTVLAHYGDAKAEEIYGQHFYPNGVSIPFPWDHDPELPSEHGQTRHPTEPLPRLDYLMIRPKGRSKALRVAIVGAYASTGKVFFLCQHAGNIPMLFLRIGKDSLSEICSPNEHHLPSEQWADFVKVKAGTFLLKGKEQRKLTKTEISRLVKGKTFLLTGPNPFRNESSKHRATTPVDVIELPEFATALRASQACPYCRIPYRVEDVCAAGIRRSANDEKTYFFYEVSCGKCHGSAMTLMTTRPSDMRGLVSMYAEDD